MKQSERDDLIKLIDDRAGPVPSAISNALAILEPFVVKTPAAHAAWKTILDANLQLGTSPGEETQNPGLLLQLRQKVLAFTVDPEEAPAPPPAPLPPSSLAVTIPWGDYTPRFPTGTFDGAVYVATVRVPATLAKHFDQGGIATFAEWQGAPIQREMVISKTPGSFDNPIFRTNGTLASITFNTSPGSDVTVVPGETYYFNVRTVSPNDGTPMSGNYPGSFSIKFPHDNGKPAPTA